jgi:ATP-dependent DNA helicase DinG
MLSRLLEEKNPLFVEWFDIAQAFGREHDVGLHSHWIDPTEPMALAVLKPADGIVITSATLKDRPPDVPDDWANAEMRTGAVHLPYPVKRESYDSPFDYKSAARIIVVTDVNREDMDQVAAAYRELFRQWWRCLGPFTAISRLRAVHSACCPLAEAGLPLYAQHVDPMDTGTLVDMFRAERDACLLGTDAVRDGVDVPGDSLADRPRPRPVGHADDLERARKEMFGGNAYGDMVIRLRLRQAFGRLIRGGMTPAPSSSIRAFATRFTTAFLPGMAIARVGLVEAIRGEEEELDFFQATQATFTFASGAPSTGQLGCHPLTPPDKTEFLMSGTISTEQALIYTMVTMSGVEGRINTASWPRSATSSSISPPSAISMRRASPPWRRKRVKSSPSPRD